MLALDMNRSSEAEIAEMVAEYCSSFGSATILNVLQPDARSHHGAAAVRMSTIEEADDLARSVGGSRCGANVIIRLAQQGERISTITKKNFFHGSGIESASLGAAN